MRVSHRWEEHEDESAKEQTEENDSEERAAEHGRPKVKEMDKRKREREKGDEECQARQAKPGQQTFELFESQHLYSATCNYDMTYDL